MNSTQEILSIIGVLVSVGIGIWREWDTILDIFTEFSRNDATTVGGLNEEIFETLQREREAEKQSSEE